ncbi:C40 family peptidase [Phytoactinopolyspora endophytica]|uniref:C40 family peptidase n=1 Tax=Phytoactinopolyspora endophytica TaxID=1642495 RepID=UPI00101DAFE4|nr:C40 family peptidase [Phytoactinopolyspora endophytica]
MPERQRRSHGSARLIAFCTAAVTVAAGVNFSQIGHADPEPSLDDIREKVDELHHEAEVATERFHLAGEELESVERRLNRAEDAIEKQEERLDAALADMAGFVAATYQTGGIDPTVRVLFADDPAAYLDQASVLDAYTRQQAGQITTVEHESRALEQAKLLADEELSRMQAIEDEREAEKSSIEEMLAESEEILDELEEEERQRLEEERRREEEEEARRRAAEEESRSDDRGDEDSDDGDSDEETDPPPASGDAGAVVDFALAQVGDPYVWAGNGPDAWDCSGLTSAAWAQAGVSLPRSSASQINVGTRVSKSQLQPGDLVFYYSPISHVGIYIGNGQMVHATHPGSTVKVDSVDLMPFAGASRPG